MTPTMCGLVEIVVVVVVVVVVVAIVVVVVVAVVAAAVVVVVAVAVLDSNNDEGKERLIQDELQLPLQKAATLSKEVQEISIEWWW